jgi:hypothetical protein
LDIKPSVLRRMLVTSSDPTKRIFSDGGPQVPLLDADLAPKPADEKKILPLRLALAVGIAALGLMISLLFLFAPTQTTKAVRDAIQAAQLLVTKEYAPAAATEQQLDEGKTATFLKRKTRRDIAAPEDLPAVAGRTQPSPAQRVTAQRRLFQSTDLPLGTARLKVRELFGEPDLALYKLEKNHIVEHFVYLNRRQNYATSVLLVDGLVTSVYSDMPSVRIGNSAIRSASDSPLIE